MKPQPITTAYDLATGRGRLRYLADEVLARVAREGLPFDLRSWVLWEEAAHDCGTAACAVGWAARDPLFATQGLELRLSVAGFEDEISPVFNGLDNWDAVAEFFGISWIDARRLFVISSYWMDDESSNPTAADVAARIRAYLAETEGA